MSNPSLDVNSIRKLNKAQCRALRYVNHARCTDDAREVLQTIKAEDDYLICCDGFRIHAVKCSIEGIENGALYELGSRTIPTEGFVEIVKSEIDPENYPKYKNIFPIIEPTAVIAINPRFFLEAISRASKYSTVIIKYYAEYLSFEIFTKDENDVPAYALIMPRANYSIELWRPDKGGNHETA